MAANVSFTREVCLPGVRRRRPDPTPVGRERRNDASRQALLARVANEYDELPGLKLTAAQACRLFALRSDIGGRVLKSLCAAHLLECDRNGCFIRAQHHRAGRRRERARES